MTWQTGYPPPGGPAPQWPYVAPGGAPPQIHRTSGIALVAMLVSALIVIAAAGSVAFLAIGRPGTSPQASIPQSGGATPKPGSGSTRCGGGGAPCVAVAPGWSVDRIDPGAIQLSYREGGQATGTSALATSKLARKATDGNALLQADLESYRARFADATVCQPPQPTTVGGKRGVFAIFCFTQQPQGGPAGEHSLLQFYAVSADGSTAYATSYQTQRSLIEKTTPHFAALIAGIDWRT